MSIFNIFRFYYISSVGGCAWKDSQQSWPHKMSKWQKPWRLFGGKCHPTSTGRVSSTGVVIVVWLKLGLKVIVGYLRTCGAQGVANKLLQSQQNVNMFFAATKIELTYLRLVYIQIQTHFSMFSAQQTSPSYEKKSFHFGPLPMFLFSASRRAQRLLLRDSWITTKPHGQTTGRSTRGDEHFPTKKGGWVSWLRRFFGC